MKNPSRRLLILSAAPVFLFFICAVNAVSRTNIADSTFIKKLNRTATFVIVSRQGTVIVTDPYQMPAGGKVVYDSMNMPEGAKPDVITISSRRKEHFDKRFVEQSNCRVSNAKAEKFSVKDVQVTGIASSDKGNLISRDNPGNVIYVFKVDGMTLVHMGDFGQDQLTSEQMDGIGKADVIFMQLANPLSNYAADGSKAINIIRQLNPVIVIPTHCMKEDFSFSLEALQNTIKAMGAVEYVNKLLINKRGLKKSKRRVVVM